MSMTGEFRLLEPNLFQERDATRLRHLQVGEYEIEVHRAELRARLGRVGDGDGFEPHVLDDDLQGAAHAAVVVDDQHAPHRPCLGESRAAQRYGAQGVRTAWAIHAASSPLQAHLGRRQRLLLTPTQLARHSIERNSGSPTSLREPT